MANYSKLSLNDLEALEEFYGWKIHQESQIVGGAANSSFLLLVSEELGKMKRKIVLSILDNHDFESANLLCKLTNIASKVVSVPKIIPLTNGQLVHLLNEKPIYAKEYVPGVQLLQVDDSQAIQLGKTIAKIGDAKCPAWLPNKGRRIPEDWKQRLGSNPPAKLLGQILVAKEFESSLDSLPMGFVHGDVFLDNLVWTQDGSITVLDWETATKDALALELGICAVSAARDGEDFLEHVFERLVAGYESHRKLEKDELSSMPQIIHYSAVMLAFQRYCRHNVRFPNVQFSDYWVEQSNFADQILLLEIKS